jgi:hypothetical protein
MYINNKVQSSESIVCTNVGQFLNGHPIFNMVLTTENRLVPLHVKIEARINLSSHMNEKRFYFYFIWENRIPILVEPTSNSQSHLLNYDFLNNNHQPGR